MRYIIFIIISILASTNSFAGPPSWERLKKEGEDGEYCVNTYKKDEDVKACLIELAAFERAKTECQKDSNAEYCVLMANSGWKNFKDMVGKKKISDEHAKTYPVMCGWKEKPIKPCS